MRCSSTATVYERCLNISDESQRALPNISRPFILLGRFLWWRSVSIRWFLLASSCNDVVILSVLHSFLTSFEWIYQLNNFLQSGWARWTTSSHSYGLRLMFTPDLSAEPASSYAWYKRRFRLVIRQSSQATRSVFYFILTSIITYRLFDASLTPQNLCSFGI